MKKFMVSVFEDIDPILAEKLQAEENRIIAKWRETGMMIAMFFHADGKGLFGVMRAETAGVIMENMKTLPFYPFMKIDIVELVGK
jgi:muconolactone delta-isomerase